MIDRRLLYVVSTARYGSFTAAAEHVGVTQSAITKSVADLEQQLGYAIFNRTARGVILTEEGRAFAERASRLLEDAQELMRGVSAGSDPYAGILRIGVCPASLEWLLVEPLSTLIARYPGIRLQIVGGSYDRIVQQLRSGAVDVALGYEAAFLEQPDFRRETVAHMLTTFFVRQGHPILDRGGEVTKADIAKYDLISPSGSSPYDYIWRQIYEDSGIDVQDRLHIVDYFPIVARLVRNTDAISVASVHYTHTGIFRRQFASVPFLDLPPSPLCCATRLRWSPRPAVRAFIKACRERLPSPETTTGA